MREIKFLTATALGVMSLSFFANSAIAKPFSCTSTFGTHDRDFDLHLTQEYFPNGNIQCTVTNKDGSQTIRSFDKNGDFTGESTVTHTPNGGGKKSADASSRVVLYYAGKNPDGSAKFVDGAGNAVSVDKNTNKVVGTASFDPSQNNKPDPNAKVNWVVMPDGSTVPVKVGAQGGAFILNDKGQVVPFTKTIDGKTYDVSTQAYTDAEKKWEAEGGNSKQKTVVKDHRNDKKTTASTNTNKAPPAAAPGSTNKTIVLPNGTRDHRHPSGTPAPSASTTATTTTNATTTAAAGSNSIFKPQPLGSAGGGGLSSSGADTKRKAQ